MKLPKALSALVLGAGCAAAFLGLLALLLPRIANDQLRLVLSSFELPARHPLVNAINACMSFCLHHAGSVLLLGVFAAVVGGVLLSLFLREVPKRPQPELYRRPAPPEPLPQSPLWSRAPEREEIKVFRPTPILEPNRTEKPPIQELPKAEPVHFEPNEEPPPKEESPAPRPRIRSTMGKHS